MKKRTKRILAMLLASAMILQQGSTVGVLATETEPASETVAETQSETTAETQAPETTAETNAPEIQAIEAALGTTQTDTPAATQTESDASQTQQSETVAAMQTEQSETVAETISSTQQSETVSQETTEAPAQTEEKTEATTEAVGDDNAASDTSSPDGLMAAGQDPVAIGLDSDDEIMPIDVEIKLGENGGKIESVVAQAKDAQGKWQDITEGQKFDRDAEFQFTLEYSFNNTEGNRPTAGNNIVTYKLPDGITITSGTSGTIYTKSGEPIGKYSVDKGVVTFTYDESWLGSGGRSEFTGNFSFTAKVNRDKSDNEKEVELQFPGVSSNPKIKFEDGKVTGNKTHTLNPDGTIDVTITFTVSGEDAKNVVITDTLGTNLNFVPDSFKLDGEKMDDLESGIPHTLGDLSIGNHTITYKVTVTDKNNLVDTDNTIKWSWGTESDSEKEGEKKDEIKFTKHSLEKKGIQQPDGRIKWEITVQPDSLSSLLGKTITDTLGEGQKYVGDLTVSLNTCEVYKGAIESDKTSFSFTFAEEGYSSTWLGDPKVNPGNYVGKSATLTYYTEPIDPTQEKIYTNKVNDGDEPDKEGEVEYDPSKNTGVAGNVLEKSGKLGDVTSDGERIIEWTIDIDPEKFKPEGAVSTGGTLTDLKVTDALELNGNISSYFSTAEEDFTIENVPEGVTWTKTWTPTNDKPTGFVVQFTGEISQKITIKCKSYSKNKSGEWQNNVVNADYKVDGVPYHDEKKPGVQITEKSGDYNFTKEGSISGKTIKWQIELNRSSYGGQCGDKDLGTEEYTIIDVLPEGLKYVENTAKAVRWGNKNGAWNPTNEEDKVSEEFVPETTYDETTRILTFKISNIRSLVVDITYETEIVGELSDGKEYTNNATFSQDGTELGKASDTVTLESTVLTKDGMKAEGKLNRLEYTLHVNLKADDLIPGSDELILTDVLDPNTNILFDTIQVIDVNTKLPVPYTMRYSSIEVEDEGEKEQITFVLPDSRAITVIYQVQVTGKVDQEISVKNTAVLSGVGSSEVVEENKFTIESSAAFAGGTENSITVRKIDAANMDLLEGAKFALYRVDINKAPINFDEGDFVEQKTTDTDGIVSFSSLQLDNLYYFVETEAPSGFKLDSTKHYFILKGSNFEDAKSKIGNNVEYAARNGGSTITLTNEKEEKFGDLKITKTVTGNNTDTTTTFHFKVTLKDGENAAAVNGTFDGVEFRDGVARFDLKPDETKSASQTITGLPAGLNYTVEEFTNEGEKTGYTLTGTTGETGTIEADDTKTAAFTNTRNKTTAELKVAKTYNGEFPTDDDDKFSFTLKDAGNDVSPAIDTPMPDDSVAGSKTVKVTSETAETFGSITYEEDGIYNYTITENSGSLHGVTYDTSVYHVKVVVTTDTNGNKSAAISVAKAENAETPVTDDDYAPQGSTIYTAGFNNTYVADGSANLAVQKVFSDTFPTGEKAFRFTLTAGTNTVTGSTIDTPMPEGANADGKTKTVSVESGAAKSFGVITYEQDGDYFYTINEVTTGTGVLSDVIYDTRTYYIKVSVTTVIEGEAATKKATVWYGLTSDEGSWQDTKQAAFTATFNNYKTQNGKAVLKVQKTYTGKNDKIPAEGFSFVLEAQGGAPMPAGTAGNTVTVSKDELEKATGPVEKSFGEIEYTESGTYTYTIKEAVPTGVGEDGIKDGILYDTTEYTVTVTVNDGQHGQKSVEVSYSPTGTTETSASFTNTEVEEQTDATGSVEIKAKKSMKKDADKALIPKFSFELAWAGAKGEAPEGQKLPMTAQPDADGNVKFTLPFTMDDYEAAHPEEGVEAKEFKYTLKELAEIEDEAKGIIYAENVYTVTVVIGEDISDGGKFDVTYTVDGLEGDSPLMEFVNDTTTVKVDKVDEAGNKLAGAKLQITVKDAATGEPVESWTTDDKTHEITGKLEVGKIYVLEETEAPTGYVVADPVEFTIDKNGNVFVGEEKMTNNLLTMIDAKLHFNVNKTELGTGDEVAGAELTVYEKQADGTLKKVEGASWTSKKGETHDFGDLLEAGKTYVLREEVAPDGYGYVTDIEFTVEEDGSITTKMTKTADAAGNDVYLVEDAKIKLEVNKKATGTGEELDGAVLELLDKDGKVLDSWTSKKGQTHDFGSKLKAGESYTLRETVAPDGYTCVTDMKFTVAEDGMVTGLDSIKTTDTSGNTVYVVEDTLNKISIEKVDESGAALSGAKLVVKDADSAVVDSWTTDGKAHEITGLAKGKYTLSEVEAPEGYQVSKDVPFEITGTEMVGSVLSLTMTDTKIPDSNKYSLTVTKHLRLDGVPSELAAKDVTYYVALFSDAEKTQRVSNVEKIEFHNETSSTVTFDKLAEGTYYVGETDENGTLLVSKIVNDEIIFYPEYSGDGKVELEGRDTDKVADFTNVYMKLTNDFYLSGQITVTKKILVNGEEGTSDETYYARLFTDPELTDPLDEILALDLAGNSSASVTVTNLPIGETLDSTRSYYVAETDENGNVLDPDAVTEFEISIDKSEIVLSANNSAQEVVITNSFTEEETETETETEVPKKAAPKTGDDTDFMRYLLLMALSAGICAVAFEEKRRRNRARK